MKNVKFIKEPGYILDLFFLFTLYFNKDYCLTNFINYSHSNEDTEYYNKLLSTLPPIPNELLPFFYISENGKSFITQYYYDTYKDQFVDNYNFELIRDLLTDQDKVIDNIISFFFKGFSENEISECKQSIITVDKLLKRCKYSTDLKCSLYSFFISPVQTIQKLSYELMSKEVILKQQYEKSYKLLSDFQNEFDFDELSKDLHNCQNQKVYVDTFDNVYVSICINHKNHVKTFYTENGLVIILGNDYKEILQHLSIQNNLPELDIFGNAISEPNRLDILNLIYENGEITIRDIEQRLGFTGTNAYYHLSLMIKAGMLKTRNKGRTVLYSLNQKYFDVLCNMLSKYSHNKRKELKNENLEKALNS